MLITYVCVLHTVYINYIFTYICINGQAVDNLEEISRILYTKFYPEEEQPDTYQGCNFEGWERMLDDLSFDPVAPTPPASPRMLYVLHLFSGAKRSGDLHSAVASMPVAPGRVLCPISIDIIFDEKSCNLTHPKVQRFWLEKSAQGLLHMVVCGPPCETWSVSRLRYLVERVGPRPIRSSDDPDLLWGLNTLRLKEIRQLRIGNISLQFCLLLVATQVASWNPSTKHLAITVYATSTTTPRLRHYTYPSGPIWWGQSKADLAFAGMSTATTGPGEEYFGGWTYSDCSPEGSHYGPLHDSCGIQHSAIETLPGSTVQSAGPSCLCLWRVL